MAQIRNIAILAHVDAGKTTLSERILFTASEIHRPGDVEDGLATMDYLPEEKKRGITIESGVAHFEWKNLWFNFIDTPGHVDFGAEVDSALSAAESAVLVVAASGGIETQTVSAWRKLREHRLRTFVFINKLDNPDYSLDETLVSLEEAFGLRPVLLSFPEYSSGKIVSTVDVLSRTRLVHDSEGREVAEKIAGEHAELEKYYAEAVEHASNVDDEILEAVLEGREITPKQLLGALKKLSASEDFVLCYAGSAKDNRSVRSLMTSLAFFAPPPPSLNSAELGSVFRLRRFKESGEVALFRSHASLAKSGWPSGFEFSRMRANLLTAVESIEPGDIYALKAPRDLELGEVIGMNGETLRNSIDFTGHYQPLLQTHLECLAAEDFEKVASSLKALSRTDPSFRVEYREELGAWILHTVGEVQLEVLLSRLEREFNCRVHASSPDVLYLERLEAPVLAFQNGFQAGPWNVSVEFSAEDRNDFEENEIESIVSLQFQGAEQSSDMENSKELFQNYASAIREALEETSSAGVLGKGPLVGCKFTVKITEMTPELPPPMLKKVVTDAFKLSILAKNVRVFEPYMELFTECPARFAGNLTGDVQYRGGRVREIQGDGLIHSFYAEVPLHGLFGYATSVRSISKGTAIYSMRFLDYREVQ